MKTQDGCANVQRDCTFLAESGMLPKVNTTLALRLATCICLCALSPNSAADDVAVDVHT